MTRRLFCATSRAGKWAGQSAKSQPVLIKQFSPHPRGMRGQLRLGYWLAGWIGGTSNDARHHRYTVSLPVGQLPCEQWPPSESASTPDVVSNHGQMGMHLLESTHKHDVVLGRGQMDGWLAGWTDVLARSRRR